MYHLTCQSGPAQLPGILKRQTGRILISSCSHKIDNSRLGEVVILSVWLDVIIAPPIEIILVFQWVWDGKSRDTLVTHAGRQAPYSWNIH